MSDQPGYELLEERFVNEINSKVSYFRHLKTGAEILSVENKDENKVFGITFRTPPTDSSGLPHIMEHSVLCGSRKFPVKEPFVELMKGSLNTFLNAFTYPDRTCYPVASTNLKDFYNLVDVYLDAVLHPILSPFTLMQEGWHYELADPNAEMTFKGVVFNEMKGAFSSPDDILGDESQMALLPDTPYGLHSGGDPEVITTLTYDQFKTYHDKYYHPSNARIFFYGDDDPDQRFQILDKYLNDFEIKSIASELPLQPAFAKPIRKVIPYDSGDAGKIAKSYVLVNWLLPEGNDVQRNIALYVLAYVLLATPASPLKKALSESGLGEDIIGQGLGSDLRQLTFSTGLRGVEAKKIEITEAFIISELKKIVDVGIDPKTIEAALNTIEFRLRENNTGSFPRGLVVMLQTLSSWLYDLDPISPLEFEEPLQAIKQHIQNEPYYFESLIQKHLLDNPHRVTVVLIPDDQLGQQREQKEKMRIENAREQMTSAEIEQIVANSLELNRRQEASDSPEALATIPQLNLKDLDRQVKTIPDQILEASSTLLYHDLFTSDILYLDIGFDLRVLRKEQLPYMRLFSRSLLEMGTSKEDFVSLTQRIGRESGGISHNLFTSDQLQNDQAFAFLFIRAKAIAGQSEELLSILEDILLHPSFNDKERFRQIVLEEKSGLEAGLIPSGHRVVNNRLKSHYSQASWATEQMSGLDYLFFIRNLADHLDREWETVQKIIAEIRKNLICQTNMVANFTIDSSRQAQLHKLLVTFIDLFPRCPVLTQDWSLAKTHINEGLTIPSQVNYVAKGANLYSFGYKYHGSMNVITSLLKTTWLWDKVRVQGGAYGGFVTFDRLSGIFSYLSYRDPGLQETLKVYDQTPDFLRKLSIPEEELTKSVIGAIGEMDAYQLPDAKGFTSLIRHLLKISDTERQQIREEILNTNLSDFHSLAEYLDQVKDKGQVVVLGANSAIEAANKAGDDFLTIQQVM